MPWTTFFPVFVGVFLLLSHADAMAPFGADGLRGVSSSLLLRAKCKFKNGELICFSNKHKDDEDDADTDDKSKKMKKTGNICAGDNHCGAGETDLETPNKYKACCEPAGGFQTAPKAPAPTEAKECGFGMIGTPPNNCDCPAGTEFMGNKGCVKKVVQLVCCTGIYPSGVKTGPDCYDTEAAARKSIATATNNGVGVTPESITCAPK